MRQTERNIWKIYCVACKGRKERIMSEFTKGEWELGIFNYPDGGAVGRCEIRQDMAILAHVYLPAENQSGFKEGQANARLIASAPTLKQQRDDLLKACNDGLKDLGRLMERLDTSEVDDTIRKMQAAIANCQT